MITENKFKYWGFPHNLIAIKSLGSSTSLALPSKAHKTYLIDSGQLCPTADIVFGSYPSALECLQLLWHSNHCHMEDFT